MFELCCYDILLCLGCQRSSITLKTLFVATCLIEVLGELLRDGTTATLTALAQKHSADASTCRSLEVDAWVVEEALILGCEQRCDNWR